MKFYIDNGSLFGEYYLETSKYNVFFSKLVGSHPYKVISVSVCRRNNFWDNIFNPQNKSIYLPPDLFFKFIPSLEELMNCTNLMSDKKINYQIDRLIKLSAFS